MYSPITALSFEIPLMQYNYTSDQPLSIGKRQFEYGKRLKFYTFYNNVKSLKYSYDL